MEGEKGVEMSNCGGGAAGSSRWNPTKEQISMLESLYNQGVRTPSAEQIQEITARLQSYGQIEGKNVFYWFQNHKARQRQKQKQESIAFFSRYLHHHHPPPPRPNVICSPYYLPQSELGLFPQFPKVLLPAATKTWRPKPDGSEKMTRELSDNINDVVSKQETLSLFPLEPTGILQATTRSSSFVSNSSNFSTTARASSSGASSVDGEDPGDQPCFFDFFSGNGCCESN